MKNSFKKYGKHNFLFEILWRCEPKDCLYFEQLYLDYYKPWIETGKGYNICKIAGSRRGTKFTEESLEKIRIVHLGIKPSQRCIEIARNYMLFNNPMKTDEGKERCRESNRYRFKTVLRIDINFNEIKEYENIHDTQDDGFSFTNVWRCCNEHKKTNKFYKHKNFYWVYKCNFNLYYR